MVPRWLATFVTTRPSRPVPAQRNSPSFVSLLEKLQLPRVPGGVVWHHTDAAGAVGVLTGGHVWAGWSRHLNDESEVQHGIEFIRRHWDRAKGNYARTASLERLLADREERTDELLSHCFVCCATLQKDSLSTFRGYGAYALGIDVQLFTPDFHHGREQVTGQVPNGIGWRTVAYTEAEKEARAKALFDAWDVLLSSWPAGSMASGVGQTWVDALYELTIVHMKHESFADEREARFYIWSTPSDPRRRVRVARNSITPYIPLELDVVNGVREIRVGPGVDRGAATSESLSDFLQYQVGSIARAVDARLPFR